MLKITRFLVFSITFLTGQNLLAISDKDLIAKFDALSAKMDANMASLRADLRAEINSDNVERLRESREAAAAGMERRRGTGFRNNWRDHQLTLLNALDNILYYLLEPQDPKLRDYLENARRQIQARYEALKQQPTETPEAMPAPTAQVQGASEPAGDWSI